MNVEQFVAAFNQRAETIGHEVRITKTLVSGEKLTALYCNEDVSINCGPKADVTFCQIICGMEPTPALLGMTAYCTALDVLTGCSQEVRNGWLKRLHLFDRQLTPAGAETTARGWKLAVRLHNPARNIMSYFVNQA